MRTITKAQIQAGIIIPYNASKGRFRKSMGFFVGEVSEKMEELQVFLDKLPNIPEGLTVKERLDLFELSRTIPRAERQSETGKKFTEIIRMLDMNVKSAALIQWIIEHYNRNLANDRNEVTEDQLIIMKSECVNRKITKNLQSLNIISNTSEAEKKQITNLNKIITFIEEGDLYIGSNLCPGTREKQRAARIFDVKFAHINGNFCDGRVVMPPPNNIAINPEVDTAPINYYARFGFLYVPYNGRKVINFWIAPSPEKPDTFYLGKDVLTLTFKEQDTSLLTDHSGYQPLKIIKRDCLNLVTAIDISSLLTCQSPIEAIDQFNALFCKYVAESDLNENDSLIDAETDAILATFKKHTKMPQEQYEADRAQQGNCLVM